MGQPVRSGKVMDAFAIAAVKIHPHTYKNL
jgi:hypothetical protein